MPENIVPVETPLNVEEIGEALRKKFPPITSTSEWTDDPADRHFVELIGKIIG